MRSVVAVAILLLAGAQPAAAARLVAQNRSLILDEVDSPVQLRAVLYSPTLWGYDTDIFYKTPYCTATRLLRMRRARNPLPTQNKPISRSLSAALPSRSAAGRSQTSPSGRRSSRATST